MGSQTVHRWPHGLAHAGRLGQVSTQEITAAAMQVHVINLICHRRSAQIKVGASGNAGSRFARSGG
jgi:hypothetical protein